MGFPGCGHGPELGHMSLRIIGEHPLDRDDAGVLRSRIATLFPRGQTLVTLPGIHATQRVAYVDQLNGERAARGQLPLTDDEQFAEWENAVDLIIDEDGSILIRPDPDRMRLAFEADELLQEIISKQKIHFLHVLNDKVREAIKRRGECWRITPLPTSGPEMAAMIARSRIGIGGRAIYYYNRTEGTRWLTCHELEKLGELDEAGLRLHLEEIRTYAGRTNRLRGPEVDFFMAGGAFTVADLAALPFEQLSPAELRDAHRMLVRKFRAAVRPELQRDDPDNIEWRRRMFSALIGQKDQTISEEGLLGLSSEFFMQIQWLPGGRIEEGELIFDSIFDETDGHNGCSKQALCDEKARGFIFNFLREYGDLEYVNLGRVSKSLSHRVPGSGRREVYIAELKQRDSAREIVLILRMQKWGVHEHLDDGKDLLAAILECDHYTDYILDRRLGCRQLGMNLPPRITARKISETYCGKAARYRGTPIWSPYFQRDYIRGIATDKMPACRFASESFAMRFAHLLGRAAAANLIVGRCELNRSVVFDDGDEVVVEDPDGMPSDIIVADHTGTFVDYEPDLMRFAEEYARPVKCRLPMVPHPQLFAGLYVDAVVQRLTSIQGDYRKRRRAFHSLFRHRPHAPGTFAHRWERVLERLDQTDPRALGDAIREHVRLA
jgi:hypothetical protein